MIDILVANRWLILVVSVVVWAWFAWAIIRSRARPQALTSGGPSTSGTPSSRGARARATPRKPADVVPMNRTSTAGLAPSIEAGLAEHHIRSAAATTKLSAQPVDDKQRPTEALLRAQRAAPTPPPPERSNTATIANRTTDRADEDAKEDLFAGLGVEPDAPAEGTGTRALKNAARMEEKGFHHQIPSDQMPAITSPAPAAAAPAAPTAPPPAAAPATPVPPTTPAAGAPRSQTAELDDILKRIDQVLADHPPAPAAPPAPPVTPPKPAASTPLDPQDVLKRIDEALAETQGERSAELTVPRPDWERDAKRSVEATVPRPDWAQEAKRAATEVPPPAPPLSRAVEPPRAPVAPAKPAEITVPRPDWEDEAKKAHAADTTPAGGAQRQDADAVPDWARADLQDEDLKRTPPPPPTTPPPAKADPSTDDAKGPQQERLF